MRKILFLVVISILLWSCEKAFKPEPPNTPVGIFENLWTTFNDEYAVFEERGVNWDSQYQIYRPMVNDKTTDDELFNILSQMLASLDDGHVRMIAPDREIFFSNTIRQNQVDDSLFNLSVVKQNYLESGFESGGDDSYIYGKIRQHNLGYIYFDHVGDNFSALTDFLDEFSEASGFIIDLRHNQGGDFTYSFEAMGRLTDQPRYVFRSKTKNGPDRKDFTTWHRWYLEPHGKFVNKPIVVLIDRYTISAGERTMMALKTLPNVTFIGDTTNGAHGTMIGRELANGWYYSLTTQKTEIFDGQSYEGIGLAPDIFLKNDLNSILAGHDQVLEKAISMLP